jgi:hypothetical protein
MLHHVFGIVCFLLLCCGSRGGLGAGLLPSIQELREPYWEIEAGKCLPPQLLTLIQRTVPSLGDAVPKIPLGRKSPVNKFARFIELLAHKILVGYPFCKAYAQVCVTLVHEFSGGRTYPNTEKSYKSYCDTELARLTNDSTYVQKLVAEASYMHLRNEKDALARCFSASRLAVSEKDLSV